MSRFTNIVHVFPFNGTAQRLYSTTYIYDMSYVICIFSLRLMQCSIVPNIINQYYKVVVLQVVMVVPSIIDTPTGKVCNVCNV